MLVRGLDGLAQKSIVRDGGEGAGTVELVYKVGVGACALRGDDVHDLYIVLQSAGGADADDVVDIIEIEQLPAVDTDGGDAHAGGHDRDGDALPCAGVPLHTADIIDEHGIGKEGIGDELRAQRIAGHEDGLCDLAFFGRDMRGGNRHNITSVRKSRFDFDTIIQ